jgi:hypothetical protein
VIISLFRLAPFGKEERSNLKGCRIPTSTESDEEMPNHFFVIVRRGGFFTPRKHSLMTLSIDGGMDKAESDGQF